jgi:hypothetical protein
MAVASGTAGSVVVGTVVVGNVSEWSLSFSREAVETSGMGQASRTFIPSVYGYSGSFSLAKDVADAGEVALKAAALGSGTVGLKLYEGTAYYNCATVIITGMSPALSFDGKSENSYDFQGSGALA